MGVGPVASPEFTGKGVRVFQRHFTTVRLANMGHHRAGLYRVLLHQTGNRRVKAGLRVFKRTTAFAFVKGDTPAIFMRPGSPTALNKPGETKANIGWHIGAHPEQFAHSTPPNAQIWRRRNCRSQFEHGQRVRTGAYTGYERILNTALVQTGK